MSKIISKSNEKVKYIKSLNEKKFRQRYGTFYIEGIKVVEEILNSKKAVDIMFIAYSDELLRSSNGGDRILQLLQKRWNEFESINVDKKIFEYVTDTKTPQGVLAVLKKNTLKSSEIKVRDLGNIIVLDKIQDLGNLGTIIRTADAFNIKDIVCVEGIADIFSPKVIRSTMGSIVRENIVYCNESEIDEFFKKLKQNNYTIYSTVLEKSSYIEDVTFNSKSVFIFGNEANGVSKNIKEMSDINIKVDMSSNTDSLNVSVAAGIVMYKQYIDSKEAKLN